MRKKVGTVLTGWHINVGRFLGNNDGREIREGRTHSIDTSKCIILCQRGLHGSETLFQASCYAIIETGMVISRVEVWGDIKHQPGDKFCGRHRRYTKVYGVKIVSKALKEVLRLYERGSWKNCCVYMEPGEDYISLSNCTPTEHNEFIKILEKVYKQSKREGKK